MADLQRSAADLLRVQGIILKYTGVEIIPAPRPKDRDAREPATASEIRQAPKLRLPADRTPRRSSSVPKR